MGREALTATSQGEEDELLAWLLAAVPSPTRWCVEFGAWDGVHLSNTHHLIHAEAHSAVLIEADESRYADLVANVGHLDRVHPMRARVGWGDADGLDALLAATQVPERFDVLSIDIDGNDFHVWAALQRYRPAVVVIEYNATIPNAVDFVQPRDPGVHRGASLRALERLGADKGYRLAAVTATNAFFVVPEVFAGLGITDGSLGALNGDQPWVTHLFIGFDGTVHLDGPQVAPWHQLPIDARRLQVVPRPLRRFPATYGAGARRALAVYRGWAWLTSGRQHRATATAALGRRVRSAARPGRR